MKRLFPVAVVIRSACFPDPDNAGGETEADVVVAWGPFLVICEAKGKRIANDAMRGNREKLKRTIRENIQDAFIQSRRVVRILERDGKIQFKEKATGRLIEVKQDSLRRVMSISVTLQHFMGIPTQLAVTQGLGLFKGNAYPWSVSIDDLDVITRFSGSPDVFLHYIERRIAHQKCNVDFHGDELDIFGHYLDNRLHPSLYEGRKDIEEHTGKNCISFQGGEERFAPFYMSEWTGEPPPSSKVEIKVPPEIQNVLNELRNRYDDGSRWIAFALLGLSPIALDHLAVSLQDLRTIPTVGQRINRITVLDGDIVINVMAQSGLAKVDFLKNVTMRSSIEHYRRKPNATITFGIDQREAVKAFEFALWIDKPWQRNQLMDKLVAEDHEKPRVVQVPSNAKKRGRNDQCPCGSGKKFKKCCIGRMIFTKRR
jgi:hypothetical protein